MNRRILGTSGLLTAGLLTLAATAQAVELKYIWKKADVHRFAFHETTTIELSMGGMPDVGGMATGMGIDMGMGMPMPGGAGGGMKMAVDVNSVFSETVLKELPGGKAEIELTVEKLEITQGGRTMDVTAKLAKKDRVMKAEIDDKGHVKFYRMVTIYMTEDATTVGIRKAKVGPLGASATASDGNEEVTVFASIDPKTGVVSGGVTKKKVAPAAPQTTAVQQKQEAPGIDALPKNLLEMLVLPDGDVAYGPEQKLVLPMGTGQVRFAASPPQAGVTNLHFVTDATGDTAAMMGKGQAMAPDGGDALQIGMPGGNAATMPTMAMKVDATSRFGVDKGRMEALTGVADSTMDTAGMKMVTHTDFTLERK